MSEYALRLTAAITHEGESYVARCLQVEVTSQGESIEEALVNLREAVELYFEDAPEPEVTDVLVAPLTVRVPVIPAGFHPRSFSGGAAGREGNPADPLRGCLAAHVRVG